MVAVAGATQGGRRGVRRIASTTMAWARHRSDSIPRRIRRRISTRPYYCPATPNRPNAATQVATTNVTRRISSYIDIVNVEVTIMNGNVRGSGGAKTGVIRHAPQNCTKLFNGSRGHLSLAAGLTAAVPLGRAPICFSEPCDNVSRLLRCLRCCAPGTLPSAGVRCLLHTSSCRGSLQSCPSGVPWTSRGAMDPG